MRYFTPELLRRTRSRDEDVAEAASAEWDDRLDDYAEHLKSLRRAMPLQARRAVRRVPSLHDADFLGYLVEKTAPRITLVVRLEGREGEPGPLMVFRYLTATPDSRQNIAAEQADVAMKGDPARHKARILLDEFDQADGNTFTHSVLLSNGRIFRAHFRDMSARRVEPLTVPGSLEEPALAFA